MPSGASPSPSSCSGAEAARRDTGNICQLACMQCSAATGAARPCHRVITHTPLPCFFLCSGSCSTTEIYVVHHTDCGMLTVRAGEGAAWSWLSCNHARRRRSVGGAPRARPSSPPRPLILPPRPAPAVLLGPAARHCEGEAGARGRDPLPRVQARRRRRERVQGTRVATEAWPAADRPGPGLALPDYPPSLPAPRPAHTQPIDAACSDLEQSVRDDVKLLRESPLVIKGTPIKVGWRPCAACACCRPQLAGGPARARTRAPDGSARRLSSLLVLALPREASTRLRPARSAGSTSEEEEPQQRAAAAQNRPGSAPALASAASCVALSHAHTLLFGACLPPTHPPTHPCRLGMPPSHSLTTPLTCLSQGVTIHS